MTLTPMLFIRSEHAADIPPPPAPSFLPQLANNPARRLMLLNHDPDNGDCPFPARSFLPQPANDPGVTSWQRDELDPHA